MPLITATAPSSPSVCHIPPETALCLHALLLRADDFYYLDYTGTTWDAMYDTDPLAGVPNVSAHEFVLGGEAAMWGESVDASNVLGELGCKGASEEVVG